MDKARIDNTARWLQRWTAAVSTLAQSLDAERVAHWLGPVAALAVSYTHLTLPTILLV